VVVVVVVVVVNELLASVATAADGGHECGANIQKAY